MKSQAQRKGGQGKRVNLLQEYHEEKRIEDQRIQLRKILIWAFIFCCLYFVWSMSGVILEQHQIKVKQEQAITSVNEVDPKSSQDDPTHIQELQIPQDSQPSETIGNHSGQEFFQQNGKNQLQKHEDENAYGDKQKGNQQIQEEQVFVQQHQQQSTTETPEISRVPNTQNQPQNVLQQEI